MPVENQPDRYSGLWVIPKVCSYVYKHEQVEGTMNDQCVETARFNVAINLFTFSVVWFRNTKFHEIVSLHLNLFSFYIYHRFLFFSFPFSIYLSRIKCKRCKRCKRLQTLLKKETIPIFDEWARIAKKQGNIFNRGKRRFIKLQREEITFDERDLPEACI